MSPELQNLFTKHVGQAFAKQIAFADVLGDRSWGVNISEGRVTFGDDLSFPMQLLGTEADGDSSWLWAWANEASNLPESLLTTCQQLRDIGERNGIPEFTTRSFSLDIVDGHTLAMIASGFHPDCCYYRGPYDGGALFFLVCDAPNEVTNPVHAERAITVLTEVISIFEVDHHLMAESFLQSQEFQLKICDSSLTATREQHSITVSFDSHGRISQIEGALNGSSSQP
ncbi:MAG: hypothetical protein KDA80_12410 [Planctomycetaceae bacterium]|nr:hypothetical protein [Planctomycetaceae bacterium]